MGQVPSSNSKKTSESFASRSMSFRAAETFGRRKQLKIGTLRKKITRTLKNGRSPDYRKHIQEMLEDWNIRDISCLIERYEAMMALKDVTTHSELARESIASLKTDLSELYEQKNLTDIVLLYNGSLFPVHRPILVSRCQFFYKRLSGISDLSSPVEIDLGVEGISTEMFSMLLKYLYTGEMTSDGFDSDYVFRQLGEKFGLPNVLEKDLLSLLESELLADINIVIKSGSSSSAHRQSDENYLEFKCHSALLSARSSYFKSFLMSKAKEDFNCLNNRNPMSIIIDESILPRQYIQVLLQCIYLDCVDLRSIIKWRSSDEANGISSETDKLLTTCEIAMELYEIGKFLDFPALCQACEDIIIEDISPSSLIGVLEWSSQPFGSNWVNRQAMHHLRENFVASSKSASFIANLPQKYLIDAVKSDFLHASEEEVLATIIRWGEWQVSKALDKQSGLTSNSLNRRSPKRKDVSDNDLQKSLKGVLQYVRINHVLPKNSVILQTAYHRGLFERPAPLDVGCEAGRKVLSRDWIRLASEKRFRDVTSPRLFIPYYKEAKAFLSERMQTVGDLTETDLLRTRCAVMPDMVLGVENHKNEKNFLEQPLERFKSYSADVVNIERRIIKAMGKREKELKRMPATQKAFSLLSDDSSSFVNSEIQKRIMREFGYPDSFACEVFRHAPDLIEDSSSSSESSRQSTLSKIGTVLNELQTGAPDVTIPAGELLFSSGHDTDLLHGL